MNNPYRKGMAIFRRYNPAAFSYKKGITLLWDVCVPIEGLPPLSRRDKFKLKQLGWALDTEERAWRLKHGYQWYYEANQ